MTTEQLQQFFEDNDFNVFLSIQDGKQCGEIEKCTDGGVDMLFFLNPFTVDEFKERVNDFDVDEEIDTHRQDKQYKNDFTISQSLKDFADFHTHLKEIVAKLN